MNRSNHIALLVGARNTGKTTFGKQLVDASMHKKILVVDTFEHPSYSEYETIQTEMLPRWKRGRKRIVLNSDVDEDMNTIATCVSNTLVIFEDCTKYIVGDLTRPIRSIIFDSKQKNNDLIFMYHGFSFIPPKVLSNANSITLFKISEKIKRYEAKIPYYESIEAAHNKIQASKNQYTHITIATS
ncbi:MAG: hypothetical protein R2831_10895 [Chitinophagaceae bacterium]